MTDALQKSIGVIRGRHAAEIAGSVETALREGRLRPGDPLPTVRALAAGLGVSPTTTAAAYRELKGRGLLVTEGRRGTRISPAPPMPTAVPAPLPPGCLDLASGNPDPSLLPRLGPFLRAMDPQPRLYASSVHLPELLELARERLAADRVPHAHLSVVSGALDGIERVLLAHLRPGDRVAVEDPGFGGVFHLLCAMGLPAEPVALDDRGPLPEALEGALRRGARAFILTPRAQNPTGAALDAARARQLRAVVAGHPEVLVIEDDHAAEVAGREAFSLCSEATPHFAVARSLSKALGPDLRVAILSGDRETIARVEGRQLLGSRWVSHVLQELAVRLWKDRRVTRLVARAERAYGARREALRNALAERGLTAQGESGLNVWVPLAEETPAAQHLLAAGYAVRAGESYRLRAGPALRITTAALPEAKAPLVAGLLAEALSPGATAPSA